MTAAIATTFTAADLVRMFLVALLAAVVVKHLL